MTFKIADLKKPTINTELKKTLSHEGLELTLCVKNDPAFMNALSRVGVAINQEKVLDKDSLKRENNGMQSSEALLFVIGEYAISDWNVEVGDDDNAQTLPINGENFNLVLENLPNLADFLVTLINEFNKLVTEFGEQVADIKKKPVKPLNGKK